MANGETYIKVKGIWHYLYRAVDKAGEAINFMLSKKRDETAATATRASELGATVAICERDKLGTCVNRGCVPKKLVAINPTSSEELVNLRTV